ncbi:interaptin-like [Melitaea cinxia]|uniref:interaptin-like n=1 Tax=Melitaea cinxia TaxID=113334 RepID=UPI001E2705A4|nr:interaptin-like [Melitaea cinxia]
MESIKKAREIIFEDTCYGRQLLSALLESKTLEEREQQVLFQKKIKHEADLVKQNESDDSSLQIANETESNEIKIKALKKQHNLDVARINQAIAKKQKENEIKEKEKEKTEAVKYNLLEEELLNQELKIKVNKIYSEKQQINEFEAYKKQIQKLRKQREENDERIHKNKSDTVEKQHIYKIIKDINDEKIKQNNEFVENGVKGSITK